MTIEEAINELQSYADHSWGGLNDAFELAIAALNAQKEQNVKVSEWISVEDRLPDTFESVLGHCPDEYPLQTVHEVYVNGFGQWKSAQVHDNKNITHWMPMPESPVIKTL